MTSNKHIIAALLAMATVTTGCGTQKHLPIAGTSVRDSVSVRYVDSTVVRYVDVEVPLPAENSSAVVPDSSHLETSVAVSDASVDSLGRLHHSIKNKPAKLPAKLPVKDEFHEKTQTVQTAEKSTAVEYVEKELTPWQSFRLKAFWWQTAIIAAFLAMAVLKLACKFR